MSSPRLFTCSPPFVCPYLWAHRDGFALWVRIQTVQPWLHGQPQAAAGLPTAPSFSFFFFLKLHFIFLSFLPCFLERQDVLGLASSKVLGSQFPSLRFCVCAILTFQKLFSTVSLFLCWFYVTLVTSDSALCLEALRILSLALKCSSFAGNVSNLTGPSLSF